MGSHQSPEISELGSQLWHRTLCSLTSPEPNTICHTTAGGPLQTPVFTLSHPTEPVLTVPGAWWWVSRVSHGRATLRLRAVPSVHNNSPA